MKKEIVSNISIENAKIIFRNFSGEERQFNPKGRRNFHVVLENDLAKTLERDGWNVRYLASRDEEEPPLPVLQVSLNFEMLPPKIVLVTNKNKTLLNEETVDTLDWAELATVDVIIRPYNWEVSGKSGVKAYLKTLYATIKQDDFESKYDDIPYSV